LQPTIEIVKSAMKKNVVSFDSDLIFWGVTIL
jgi:hypothetical protein